jgi:PAS domain S-box-containing protein
MAIKNSILLKEELKRTREDLSDLERYVKELSSFLPLPVCTLNSLKFVIDVNQAFQDLTCHKAIKIIGTPLANLFLEKKELESLLNRVRAKEKYVVEELTLISKGKKEIPVSLSVSARKDEAGNFIGYFVALSDITRIKKYRESLEEQVKERTKELREKIGELEKFQKIAVGRELKMVELKEEIKKIKEDSKGYEKRNPQSAF